MCKPIIPLLQDAYEHAFNEVEHLAKVHHQNGMNHVNYEVGKMAKEDNTNDNSSKAKSSSETAFHFLVENQLSFDYAQTLVDKIYFDRQTTLYSISASIQLPPPKF